MTVETQTSAPSKGLLYTGYTLSILSILFFLLDASMKFTHSAAVVQTTTQLGLPPQLIPTIGVIALVCIAIYAIPATSVLGAILLTGYLGGAIAVHLRVDNPLFSYTLFPIYIALFIWGGIWLRNRELRQLFPITPPFTSGLSRRLLWTGYILTALSALLMLFAAVMKFAYTPPPGAEASPLFPMHHMHTLGYLEFGCILIYLFPRTSFLGAVLTTGYLGGATIINLRSGESVGMSLIPVYIGVILWAGLWLRNEELRRFIPLHKK